MPTKLKEEEPGKYVPKIAIEKFQEIKLSMLYNGKVEKQINCSQTAFNYFKKIWAEDIGIRERFYVVYLNQQNQPIGWYEISAGGITSTIVDKRLVLAPIFVEGIVMNATGLFIAHNHPSGNLKASKGDKSVTKLLKEVCDLHDIKLLDHLILVPENNYYSFADDQIL